MAKENTTPKSITDTPPLLGRGGPGSRIMDKPEKAKDAKGTVLRIWRYLSHQKVALIVTTLMVIVSTSLNLLGPYLMGVAIDDYIITHDLAGLARLLLLMVGAYALLIGVAKVPALFDMGWSHYVAQREPPREPGVERCIELTVPVPVKRINQKGTQ